MSLKFNEAAPTSTRTSTGAGLRALHRAHGEDLAGWAVPGHLQRLHLGHVAPLRSSPTPVPDRLPTPPGAAA